MKSRSISETSSAALTAESPLWDQRRNCLWWIDIQGQRLLGTRDSDGGTTEIALPSMPGFVLLDTQDNLLVGLEDGLWSYSPEAQSFQFVQSVEADRPDNRLNEGKADAVGRLWFGSMNKFHPDVKSGALYVRHQDGTINCIIENIGIPNALAFSINSKILYFAETLTGIVSAYQYEVETGRIGKKTEFARYDRYEKPDGACVDSEGGVWIAVVGGSRLDRFLPDGSLDRRINLPVSRPTMAAFGNVDWSVLYVTSQRRFLSFLQLEEQPYAGQVIALQPGLRGIPPDRVIL